MRPLDGLTEADERLDELALAVAFDSRDADDFAAVDGERHVVEHRAHVLDDGEPCDVELDLVGDSRLASSGLGSSLPDHQLRELAGRHRPSAARDATVRPARTTVIASATASTSSSLWLMNMHRHTFGGELAERLEQLVDLLRHQHRGGLVEDQDAGAAVEHLEDLDPLAIADAEVGDQRLGLRH